MATHYTIGLGHYRNGAPFSEIKALLEAGRATMYTHGLRDDALKEAAHLYVRTFRQYYEQNGKQQPSEHIKQDLIQCILNSLKTIKTAMHKSTGLSTADFTYGTSRHDAESCALEPFTPATLPEPEAHTIPQIPEEQVEPLPASIKGNKSQGPGASSPSDGQ